MMLHPVDAQIFCRCAGLVSAMYMKEETPVENPDASSGLYIRDARNQDVKAAFPADHLAYQMGEAMQVRIGQYGHIVL